MITFQCSIIGPSKAGYQAFRISIRNLRIGCEDATLQASAAPVFVSAEGFEGSDSRNGRKGVGKYEKTGTEIQALNCYSSHKHTRSTLSRANPTLLRPAQRFPFTH